jgi:hypothetical protein
LYNPIEWHSLPDNVTSAREEIGWPALWADVGEPIPQGPDAFTVQANWNGFRFFELALEGLGDPHPLEPPDDSERTEIIYKYVPAGYTDGADTSRLIVNSLAKYWQKTAGIGESPGETVQDLGTVREGTGSFRFLPARWEDMPTQYHVVNRMAELPLLEFRDAAIRFQPGVLGYRPDSAHPPKNR